MTPEKDEDLTDLINNETVVNWDYVKSAMSEMSTGELMEVMTELGLYVNKSFALEIAKREDAVFWLRKLLQDGRYWYQGGPGDAWSPIHTIHLLALIKSRDALELFLDVLRFRSEDLSDWLTENVPSILVAFGEDAIGRLKEFSYDETLEPFARGMVTESLTILVKKFPSYEKDIKSHLIKLLNTTDDPVFAGLVADDLASFHDPSVILDIHGAFEEERIDGIMITEEEIVDVINGVCAGMDGDDFRRNTRDPLDHFSRKNIEDLHSIYLKSKKKSKSADEKPKKGEIGRNDPCPCGSGKKYKKCCITKKG